MADKSGQIDIRGLDIDKLAKGFADEASNTLRKHCLNSKTNATQIRWYQKTAGFLDSVDTDGITASAIPSAPGALPVVVEASWTRTTSYTKPYTVESPLMTNQDIKACDVDVIATNVRDLVRAVQRQIDLRVYNVLTVGDTGAGSSTLAITHEWDDATNAVPISDMLQCREKLKNYNYEANGAIFAMRPDVNRFLLNHLIAVKGSSIPQFASAKMNQGVILEIMGFKVVETTAVTSDKAVIFVPKVACTWKSLTPISTAIIDEPLIGKKIRVLEEGEAILTDPYAVVYITNIGPS